jgi:hypothetical protein
MATQREIDPSETPLDPDATQMQPPLSGTVDDDDNRDDERWDENEAPTRKPSDRGETPEELRLDEREEELDREVGTDEDDRTD